MKLNKLLFILFVMFAGSHPVLADDPPAFVNVVFDINGVTMDGMSPTPFFGEMISVLAANPRYRIYFFSTQSRRSVLEQVSMVRLTDGRTADEVAQIFDGSYMGDLDRSEVRDPLDRFLPRPGGYYKDLRALVPLDQLPNTILVDDTFGKSHPDQGANLLWLRIDLAMSKVETEPLAEVVPSKPKGFFDRLFGSAPLLPASVNGGLFDRSNYINRRADLILGTIQLAVKLADENHLSVSQALRKIQWERQHPSPRQSEFLLPKRAAALIDLGEKARQSVRVNQSGDCGDPLRN